MESIVVAVERHPRGAVGLLEVTAGRQRLRAVEDADVVEAEEAAGEEIVALRVLAVDPPGEVEQQLLERALEEDAISRAALAPSSCTRASTAQACTGGFTSSNANSYAGICPLGCMYHSRSSSRSCSLANCGIDARERDHVKR